MKVIRLTIDINGKAITHRAAVNVSADRGLEYGKGKQVYEVYDFMTGNIWEIHDHNHASGANALARKMLKVPPNKTGCKDQHVIDTGIKFLEKKLK